MAGQPHKQMTPSEIVAAECAKIYASKIQALTIATVVDLAKVPTGAGCYWIETTIPAATLAVASGRRMRKSVPEWCTRLITQVGTASYVIYNGTEDSVVTRLGQHLFNQGDPQTTKLGFDLSQAPYNAGVWKVNILLESDYVLRYAVEAWTRRAHGWPQFCLR